MSGPMEGMAGRRVLITGASGGLGGPVTRAFLEFGARTAGTARRWRAGETPGGGFLAIEADLSTPEGCAKAVQQTVESFGGLDALVHLMGGFATDGPVDRTRIETFDRMMEMNVRSAFLLFREAVGPVAAARGSIVAVGSLAGRELPAGLSAYAVSKAALHALIVVLAKEGAGRGFTANAVLPSTIDTPANRAAMPDADFSKWVQPAAMVEKILELLGFDGGARRNGALVEVTA
jgi:NAD(P)-dependent dehydrogenase (short-subunit alcohol dehydrogenase family)